MQMEYQRDPVTLEQYKDYNFDRVPAENYRHKWYLSGKTFDSFAGLNPPHIGHRPGWHTGTTGDANLLIMALVLQKHRPSVNISRFNLEV